VAGSRDDEDVVHLSFSGVVNVDLEQPGAGPTYHGAAGPLDIHPSGRTLYVVDQTTNELAVVDTASAAEVARVPVGVAPQDVLLDRRRGRVFVTSTGDSPNALPDAVTAINATTNALAATFDGGWAPVGMALVRNKGLLLVTNFYNRTLLVMRARTGELLRPIAVGLGADAVAVVR
jgi:YVTN family beta-propeller protein